MKSANLAITGLILKPLTAQELLEKFTDTAWCQQEQLVPDMYPGKIRYCLTVASSSSENNILDSRPPHSEEVNSEFRLLC